MYHLGINIVFLVIIDMHFHALLKKIITLYTFFGNVYKVIISFRQMVHKFVSFLKESKML